VLEEFFGAYFNPDWQLDAVNASEVVAEYAGHTPLNQIQGVVTSLRELLAEPLDEQALHDLLRQKYSSYYDPRQAGTTMRAWLTELERHVASGDGSTFPRMPRSSC